MTEEAQIIKKCLRKDKRAQKILFDRYAPILLGVCRRYSVDLAEAEDMMQEGFLKIFLNLKSYSEKGPLINWMKKIMVNTAITYYHKNYKHRHHFDVEEPQVSGLFAIENFETDYTREELLNVIENLPPGYKMVFNLYAIEGYKHHEIAEMMRIDVNTSKSQYSRAKKLIRENLSKISKTLEKRG